MNIEEFPVGIKNDIEDQSLSKFDRISQRGRIENTLALAAGLDIGEHVRKVKIIEDELKRSR